MKYLMSGIILFTLSYLVSPNTDAGLMMPSGYIDDSVKGLALTVLETKCNSCHKKRNSFRILTLANMDQNVKKINKQVFVLGKMPKKEGEALTDTEKDILAKWIAETVGNSSQ